MGPKTISLREDMEGREGRDIAKSKENVVEK
jgi:hypothetical protein